MRTLRFAVIGLRGMGRQHVKEIRSLPSAELAAVADTDEGLANTVGKEQGASVWNDYREMIDRTSLDAVVVATPHHLHGSMGLDCLQAGLHTFVEKPISNTVSEADRLVGESRDRGLKLAVGHNYRTFPGNRALKRLIDDGVLGEISRVCWMWLETRSESYYDRDIWRCTWEHAGGGVLMNQTSHDIDLLCWMLGDPVEVSAMIS
ncbi:MAG: Gfo/Idh/MocA family oxidoreductase, partial [Candidatus Latescibacteria bacterium]|nr:Gfo/Idh/MocA family oxidoreductase [Candidatus Latescibacterota bacterium]